MPHELQLNDLSGRAWLNLSHILPIKYIFFHISHIIDSNTGLQHGSYIHVDKPEFVMMETKRERYVN